MEGVKDEYLNNGQNFLTDMNNCLLDISQALSDNQPLLQELKKFRDKQKTRFEKLSLGESR